MVRSPKPILNQQYCSGDNGCCSITDESFGQPLQLPGLAPSDTDESVSTINDLLRYIKRFYKPVIFYGLVTLFLTFTLTKYNYVFRTKTWSEKSWTEILTGNELQEPDSRYIQSQSPEIYEDVLNDLREMQRAASYLQIKQQAIEKKTNKLEDELKKITKTNQYDVMTEAKVKYMINDALQTYDADKLGLRDYALESAGGTIIAVPNTVPYLSETRFVVFGIFSYRIASNPREILQPDIQPGRCFAFEGSDGRIRIRLANIIQVSAITLEHSPVSLLTDEELKSAPKDFELMGLLDEEANSKFSLGHFTYSIGGTSMQTFLIPNSEESIPVQYVEFIIKNNYGHNDYTCVYRVRIHGKRLVY